MVTKQYRTSGLRIRIPLFTRLHALNAYRLSRLPRILAPIDFLLADEYMAYESGLLGLGEFNKNLMMSGVLGRPTYEPAYPAKKI
jgi:hypothetical protein